MRDDNYNNREQKIIDNIPKSIDEVKVRMGSELVSYAEGRSATQDSLNYINGNVSAPNPDFFDAGNEVSAEKSKQRVLTMNNTFPEPMKVSEEVVNNPVNKPNYGPVTSDYSQVFDEPRSSGSVTTLILVFSALLIAMVALVSVMIFNYIGF